jgi:Porin PorA
MRRSSVVLIIVGVLLLAGAGAVRFLAYPAVDQLPADFDRTAVYSGTGTFLNPSALQTGNTANALLADQDVTVDRHVKVTSTHGDTAVVADDITGKLTNGTTVINLDHTWAVDRKNMGAAAAPSGVTVDPHQGITIAFPIDVKPQDYTYWDSNTQQAVPAKYQRTENYSGRTAYVFTVAVNGQVKDSKLLAALPAGLPKSLLTSLAGLLPAAAQAQLQALAPSLPAVLPMAYTSANSVTAWIDSKTGLPLNVEQQETVTAGLSVAGAAVALLPVLQFDIKNTPASIAQATTDAKNYTEGLSAVGTWVPLALLVLGLLCLLAALLVRRRRRSGPPPGTGGSGGPDGSVGAVGVAGSNGPGWGQGT